MYNYVSIYYDDTYNTRPLVLYIDILIHVLDFIVLLGEVPTRDSVDSCGLGQGGWKESIRADKGPTIMNKTVFFCSLWYLV